MADTRETMSYQLSMQTLIFGSLAFCLSMLAVAWVVQQVERLVLSARANAALRERTSYSITWIYKQNPRAAHKARNG